MAERSGELSGSAMVPSEKISVGSRRETRRLSSELIERFALNSALVSALASDEGDLYCIFWSPAEFVFLSFLSFERAKGSLRIDNSASCTSSRGFWQLLIEDKKEHTEGVAEPANGILEKRRQE